MLTTCLKWGCQRQEGDEYLREYGVPTPPESIMAVGTCYPIAGTAYEPNGYGLAVDASRSGRHAEAIDYLSQIGAAISKDPAADKGKLADIEELLGALRAHQGMHAEARACFVLSRYHRAIVRYRLSSEENYADQFGMPTPEPWVPRVLSGEQR